MAPPGATQPEETSEPGATRDTAIPTGRNTTQPIGRQRCNPIMSPLPVDPGQTRGAVGEQHEGSPTQLTTRLRPLRWGHVADDRPRRDAAGLAQGGRPDLPPSA